MRLLALIGAMLLVAAPFCPAEAWLDSKPGGEYWPPIPGNAGIAAFYGTWWPQCWDGAWKAQGEMIVEPDGVLRYTAKEPYFPTRYRVIETTPYGVTLVARTPADTDHGELFYFWVLRFLNVKNNLIGVNECFPDDMDIKGFRWDFTDAELKQFWSTFKACNPALTRKDPSVKDEGYQYWGDGWSQSCDLYRMK
ncbi:MAG: hypothetical protein AB1744_15110 [Candidatus Zixiibacteriota bacterium]